MKIVLVSILVLIVVSAVSFGGCAVNSINTEVRLRNSVRAKSTDDENYLDAMWKIIQQKANITKEASTNAKEMNKIYSDLVSGRSGGTLFKMVTENYPNLGQAEVTKLYEDLMRSVEAERKTFRQSQSVLQDLLREHDNAQDTFPNNLILSWFGGPDAKRKFMKKGDARTPEDYPIEWQYTWVTSSRTKQAVETGEDNDIELFKNK